MWCPAIFSTGEQLDHLPPSPSEEIDIFTKAVVPLQEEEYNLRDIKEKIVDKTKLYSLV